MLDKNGVEIKTGMVVKIDGAYFKNDNGVYLVTNSPKDPQWVGHYYSLRRINKRTGALSVAKNNIGSWPIGCFSNSYDTRQKCNAWNSENATIEVIGGIPLREAVDYFEVAASRCASNAADIVGKYGCMTPEASDFDRMCVFFTGVSNSLKAGGVH